MNRRSLKRLVRELLVARDLESLVAEVRRDRRVVGALSTLLYEPEALLRWRAVEALGATAAAVAETNIEAVRDLLRRQLWLMNDESGGAGWHAPETIAAVVVNVPELIDGFGVLLGSYLHEEPLQAGAHWGVAVVAAVRPNLFADLVGELTASLTSPDPFIRGCAVFALAALDDKALAEATILLRDDRGVVELYSRDTGRLRDTSIGEIVRRVTAVGDSRGAIASIW
jgi:hypothetical protein